MLETLNVAGNKSPQKLNVDSAKIARLVKYNAFGEGKHVVPMLDDLLHSSKQKLNTMLLSCIIKLQGVKALCCPAPQGLLYAY